jgi:hypothetical protein
MRRRVFLAGVRPPRPGHVDAIREVERNDWISPRQVVRVKVRFAATRELTNLTWAMRREWASAIFEVQVTLGTAGRMPHSSAAGVIATVLVGPLLAEEQGAGVLFNFGKTVLCGVSVSHLNAWIPSTSGSPTVLFNSAAQDQVPSNASLDHRRGTVASFVTRTHVCVRMLSGATR